MKNHMSRCLPAFLAVVMCTGCYASQQDVARVRTELQAEMRHTANARALAVHECATTRHIASSAAQWCARLSSANMDDLGSCAVQNLWESYCLMTVPRGRERVLVNPRPGVDQAIYALINTLEQNHQSSEDSEEPTQPPQPTDGLGRQPESAIRTFEVQ